MNNEKKSIQPGDLVFFVRTVGGKVFDGTVLAVHPDGTYKIHDASIGGTYEHIPGEHIFTDRSDAEARNEADFAAEVDAYLSMMKRICCSSCSISMLLLQRDKPTGQPAKRQSLKQKKFWILI